MIAMNRVVADVSWLGVFRLAIRSCDRVFVELRRW